VTSLFNLPIFSFNFVLRARVFRQWWPRLFALDRKPGPGNPGGDILMCMCPILNTQRESDRCDQCWLSFRFCSVVPICAAYQKDGGLGNKIGSHLSSVPRARFVPIWQGFRGLALVCRVKQQVKLVGLGKVLKHSLSSLQIPVVMELSQNNNIDLHSLVWALAMGSCLGGEAHMQNPPKHHAGPCTTLAAETD